MIDQISIFDLLKPYESRLTCECRCGSGIEGGRVRIYCASLQLDVKGLAEFLKKEYGIGGHSITFPDGERGFADHDPKGVSLRAWKETTTERHSWQEVAREVKRLIYSGEYLTEKEKGEVERISKGGAAPMPIARYGFEEG